MRSLLRRIDRNTLTLSAGVLLAFGLLAMQRVPQLDLRQITARRLQLRLQQTPDAQVPELLARIAELDDAGLPRITAALGDDRPAIALAASDLLDRRLDRWTMLSVDESTPHLDQLAKSLAALAPSLGANGRARAARIAERILLWPVDRNLINGPNSLPIASRCWTATEALSRQVGWNTIRLSAWQTRETPNVRDRLTLVRFSFHQQR